MTPLQLLERDLRWSLRQGALFGFPDEPLDDAGKRLVRVIVESLKNYEPCSCTDQTLRENGTCRACGRYALESAS